jgi:hypothetical protein
VTASGMPMSGSFCRPTPTYSRTTTARRPSRRRHFSWVLHGTVHKIVSKPHLHKSVHKGMKTAPGVSSEGRLLVAGTVGEHGSARVQQPIDLLYVVAGGFHGVRLPGHSELLSS